MKALTGIGLSLTLLLLAAAPVASAQWQSPGDEPYAQEQIRGGQPPGSSDPDQPPLLEEEPPAPPETEDWWFDFEPVWTTVVARAVTFFNETPLGDPVFTSVVAREFSFSNNTPLGTPQFTSVVTREFSFRNQSPFGEPNFNSVVAREFSFFNDTVAVDPVFTTAVAREFSFRNDAPVFEPEFTTVVTREFSFYNALRDLRVTSATAPQLAEPGATIPFSWSVENFGVEEISGSWIDRVYASTDEFLDPEEDVVLASRIRFDTLAPEATYDVEIDLTLPAEPALYWLFVKTDADDAIFEVDEDNNAGSTTVRAVDPDYTATVTASVEEAPAGTPVLLSGTATMLEGGAPAAFVPVEIRVTLRGVTRVFTVESNANGGFSYIFEPSVNEAGIYDVAADHPYLQDPEPEDTFTLHGLRIAPGGTTLNLAIGVPRSTDVTLTNYGDAPLTELAVDVANLPDNFTLDVVGLPDSLPPAGSAVVTLTVTAADDTNPSASATLGFTSAQGAAGQYNLNLNILVPTPQLVAQPSSLSASMLRGTRRFIEFDLVNTGGAPTSELTVVLPDADWLALASPDELQPLMPGESTTLILQLDPAEDLPLGPYSGYLVIDGTPSLQVPFTFTAVSEATGDLIVEVTDEFTYVMEGNPRVAGATVIVRDAYTHAEIAAVETGEDGLAVFTDLNEAWYEVVARAPEHGSFQTVLLLPPGEQTDIEAFLPRELVSYEWYVIPIDYEDRYEIILEAIFETNVPLPVITIDPPLVDLSQFDTPTRQIDFTITNHGLISAQNVQVVFASSDRFAVTPLFTTIGELPAQTSIVVPVEFEDLMFGQGPGGCFAPYFGVEWEIIMDRPRTYDTHVYFLLPDGGDCGGPIVPCEIGDCGIGGIGGGGGIGGPPAFSLPVTCTPCDSACLARLLDCPLPEVPAATPQAPLESCLASFTGDAPVSCASTATSAIIEATAAVGPFVALVDCLAGAAENCPCPEEDPPLRGLFDPVEANSGRPVMAYFINTVNRLLARFDAAVYPLGNPYWFAAEDAAGAQTLRDWLLEYEAAQEPGSDAGLVISAAEETALLALPLPSHLVIDDAALAIARWNRTLDYWGQGIYNVDDLPPEWDPDFIARDLFLDKTEAAIDAVVTDRDEGYDNFFAAPLAAHRLLREDLLFDEEGVCVRVVIQISQEAVVARSAFEAGLTLDNNGDLYPLDLVFADIEIRDVDGNPAEELFGVLGPSVTGSLTAFDGTQSLDPLESAGAVWTIVPGDDAAPTEPVEYDISGILTYELDGELITIPLYQTRVTVLPNPRFYLQYFLERIVYSDDPFTPEIVEAPVPFSLGIIATNIGVGDALDFEITSSQPEIVDNDSGLLIDFQILAAQLGFEEIEPTLTIDFGPMPAGISKVGRWLMIASLEGEFISFTGDYVQLGPLGELGLSLIEGIDYYLMHHVVRVDIPDDDRLPDFLTDDPPPHPDNLPDTIHDSDGVTTYPVLTVLDATFDEPIEIGDYDTELTVTYPSTGWHYVRLTDPGNASFGLRAVIRDDGRALPVPENAWTTSRVERPEGQPPIPLKYLHLVDYVEEPGTYNFTASYFGPGDMNCDGVINNFDIDPFVMALTDPQEFYDTYPDCDIFNGDINNDRAVDNFDIDPFVDLLTSR